MKPRALSTLSMLPTTKLVKLGSAHVICWLSMRQCEKFASPRIGIASNFHLIFVNIAYQVFLTTSSIGLRVQKLKFWSLPRIVVDQATGRAGFNWLIDPTCGGRADMESASPARQSLQAAAKEPAELSASVGVG